MNFIRSEHSFISSNKADRIAYYIYTPTEGKAKALVQICHGMCEYAGRYEHFIDCLCKNGYAVIAHDQLGHGNSVADEYDLGYFALENGWICLIKDMRHVMLIGKQMFGNIPHYVIGHSMGSLVTRCLLAKYSSDVDGAVILGTVGNHPAVHAGILMADKEIMLHGVKSRSRKINRLLFGMSNARIADRRTEFDWVSRDEQVVADYCGDKKCNFIFTASAFRDLFMLLMYCTSRSWYGKVRKDLPMLIMSGTEDPIGSYGKGVMQFYRRLDSHGFTDVRLKLWDGCRHELLNETNRLEVYDDIIKWLDGEVALQAGDDPQRDVL